MPAFYYSIGARYYKCERFTITMEVSCMKTQRRTADEQYQLIMECRSSGLSVSEWCRQQGVTTTLLASFSGIPLYFAEAQILPSKKTVKMLRSGLKK